MRVNVKPKAAAVAVAKGAGPAAAAAGGQQKKKQQAKKKQQQSRGSAATVPRRGATSNGRKTGGRGSEAKAADAAPAATPSAPIYDSDDSYEHHVIDLKGSLSPKPFILSLAPVLMRGNPEWSFHLFGCLSLRSFSLRFEGCEWIPVLSRLDPMGSKIL